MKIKGTYRHYKGNNYEVIGEDAVVQILFQALSEKWKSFMVKRKEVCYNNSEVI